MVTRFVAVGFAVLLIEVSLAAAEPLPGVGRTFGYVPDEATAIRVAVTVWEPIYGKEHIESLRPFSATLVKGVWWVLTTGPQMGGGAEAAIRQRDGKVLRINHGL